ncbi:hypothetical protein GGS20DRAFT_396698 [Poronia punctata]|nr:hypothetical protein GGS20DRAFT_396698 [Poronia punctata]
MPDFEFVNVDRPGSKKTYSTKIRRHVMKDIGKSRRKPKQLHKRPTGNFNTETSDGTQDITGRHKYAAASGLGDGNDSSGLHHVDEERLKMARYLFTEARKSYRPFHSPWPASGLSTTAAWYMAMADAVMIGDPIAGQDKSEFSTSTEAMESYVSCLTSVAGRLSEPREMVHDGLIIAIVGLVCHDTATGNLSRQDINLQCLQQLVHNRGGLDEIHNPLLRFIISWHDLSAASYRNTAPYFKVPQGAITEADIGVEWSPSFQKLLDSWNVQCPNLGDIRSALRATAVVANYVNQHCHEQNFWAHDLLAARLLATALDGVLSLEGRALPGDPADPNFSGTAAREAFRRGLLVFLASLKVRFGAVAFEPRRHLDDFRLICQIPHVRWTVVPEFNLWAHTVAALLEDAGRRGWHVAAIAGIMESMSLSSGLQALDLVRSIIWIEALFSDKVEGLCDEIDSVLAKSLE